MSNDGGPAFPGAWTNWGDRHAIAPDGQHVSPSVTVEMGGMSLRDYFAGQALIAICGSEPTLLIMCNENNEVTSADVASAAYEMADAMLKERDSK